MCLSVLNQNVLTSFCDSKENTANKKVLAGREGKKKIKKKDKDFRTNCACR